MMKEFSLLGELSLLSGIKRFKEMCGRNERERMKEMMDMRRYEQREVNT